jgi:hypothetical protein
MGTYRKSVAKAGIWVVLFGLVNWVRRSSL